MPAASLSFFIFFFFYFFFIIIVVGVAYYFSPKSKSSIFNTHTHTHLQIKENEKFFCFHFLLYFHVQFIFFHQLYDYLSSLCVCAFRDSKNYIFFVHLHANHFLHPHSHSFNGFIHSCMHFTYSLFRKCLLSLGFPSLLVRSIER